MKRTKPHPEGSITVTVALVQRKGNARPYFSVTGKICSLDRTLRDPIIACGCIHDELLRAWPDLADVVALHLADDDGAPMYALDNGWYWLAGAMGGMEQRYHGANSDPARTAAECLDIFAKHARVPLHVAESLVALYSQHSPKEARAAFAAWVEAQRPRWKAEADAIIAKYQLVVENQ